MDYKVIKQNMAPYFLFIFIAIKTVYFSPGLLFLSDSSAQSFGIFSMKKKKKFFSYYPLSVWGFKRFLCFGSSLTATFATVTYLPLGVLPWKIHWDQISKVWWLKFQPTAASVTTVRVSNETEMLIWEFPIVFLGSYLISLPDAESGNLLVWSLVWRSGLCIGCLWKRCRKASDEWSSQRNYWSDSVSLCPAFASHLSCWSLGPFFYT